MPKMDRNMCYITIGVFSKESNSRGAKMGRNMCYTTIGDRIHFTRESNWRVDKNGP